MRGGGRGGALARRAGTRALALALTRTLTLTRTLILTLNPTLPLTYPYPGDVYQLKQQLGALLQENQRQGGDNQRLLAENRDLRAQLVRRGDNPRTGAADSQRGGGGGGDNQRLLAESGELRAQLQVARQQV